MATGNEAARQFVEAPLSFFSHAGEKEYRELFVALRENAMPLLSAMFYDNACFSDHGVEGGMKTKSALMATAVLFLASLSLVTSAQDHYWGYPYAPYGHGMFAPPMLPIHRTIPIRPVPPAFVPGPARYPLRHSVALELLPLSQLGRKLEWIGYEAVYEAKLKDDVWEFLAKRGGDLEVITLDSYTGRLLSREPLRPAPEMPFATVVNHLEKEGYTKISEVEFEDGVWEIEATKDGETLELIVELVSGRMEIRTAD